MCLTELFLQFYLRLGKLSVVKQHSILVILYAHTFHTKGIIKL
jgi:hypothetical protein